MQGLARNRQVVIPEFVKALLHGSDGCADCEYIVVGELGVGVDLEVLIADVASAGQGDGLVGNEQLVVHPVVESGMVGEILEVAKQAHVATIGPRVVNANFDVGYAGEIEESFVAGHGVSVIYEDAYADAACGRALQSRPNSRAGLITSEYVVLKIERARGGINQLDAG